MVRIQLLKVNRLALQVRPPLGNVHGLVDVHPSWELLQFFFDSGRFVGYIYALGSSRNQEKMMMRFQVSTS